jgi:hypothetical protein
LAPRCSAGGFSLSFDWGTASGTYDSADSPSEGVEAAAEIAAGMFVENLPAISRQGCIYVHPERAPLEDDP